jgi:hypothetical protein
MIVFFRCKYSKKIYNARIISNIIMQFVDFSSNYKPDNDIILFKSEVHTICRTTATHPQNYCASSAVKLHTIR